MTMSVITKSTPLRRLVDLQGLASVGGDEHKVADTLKDLLPTSLRPSSSSTRRIVSPRPSGTGSPPSSSTRSTGWYVGVGREVRGTAPGL